MDKAASSATRLAGDECRMDRSRLLRLKSYTAVLREAWAMLPESSSRSLPATLAQSRNLVHASLETAVVVQEIGLVLHSVLCPKF